MRVFLPIMDVKTKNMGMKGKNVVARSKKRELEK
jgi:hypothetical protein